MPKLSVQAKKRISESMRKMWAARRATQQGTGTAIVPTSVATTPRAARTQAGTAIERALLAIRTLTIGDIQSLAQRKGSAQQVTELAQLATELKGLLAPTARSR